MTTTLCLNPAPHVSNAAKLGRLPGADVMIFEILSQKILAFFAQTTAGFCKNLIVTLVFEKNANFFAENWNKNRRKL
jgi:hypothetical protein